MLGSINLFGSMQVYDANQHIVALPNGRSRELLAALALEAGHAQSRDELAEKIWGSDNSEAKKALNTTLWRLRKTLSDHSGCSEWLTAEGDTLCLLDHGGPEIDVDNLTELINHPHAMDGDTIDLVELVESFEPLLLSDLSGEWLEEYRREYREYYVQLLGEIASLLEEDGDLQYGMLIANRLVKADPFDERGWRLTMRAHIARGQSLACCEILSRTLWDAC